MLLIIEAFEPDRGCRATVRRMTASMPHPSASAKVKVDAGRATTAAVDQIGSMPTSLAIPGPERPPCCSVSHLRPEVHRRKG